MGLFRTRNNLIRACSASPYQKVKVVGTYKKLFCAILTVPTKQAFVRQKSHKKSGPIGLS